MTRTRDFESGGEKIQVLFAAVAGDEPNVPCPVAMGSRSRHEMRKRRMAKGFTVSLSPDVLACPSFAKMTHRRWVHEELTPGSGGDQEEKSINHVWLPEHTFSLSPSRELRRRKNFSKQAKNIFMTQHPENERRL